MMGRQTGSGRALALAAAVLCLGACQQPQVGARAAATTPSEGPTIVLEGATLDPHGHVVATFSVTRDHLPLALADVTALAPRFTLATLSTHPVDGLRAWRSELLTGAQTATALPPSGPGTPAALVLASARQPGSETPASLVDLGGGRYRYAFASPLAGADPDATVRVGVYLRAAPRPSARTAATLDFRPSGGSVAERDTVLDERCNGCHGNLVAHDGRAGVRLCLTCHTWQAADPDTIDPAALVTSATTAATDPNPLELGRLVHRLHRGKNLPTLYRSSTRANPAPALQVHDGQTFPPELVDTVALSARLPFTPENNPTAILGRKYSVVGFRGAELVGGRVVQRADNGILSKALATGIAYPRDLRDCRVCHDGAPQASWVDTAISRRVCAGCHPDVWYQGAPATLDEAHFAHSGGVQDDDTRCANCHVSAPAGWRLYAPLAELHAPIRQSVRGTSPRFELVRVTGLKPGSAPVVTFRVVDRYGPVRGSLKAPDPVTDPDAATSSYLPRGFASLSINVAGPTVPDYGEGTTFLITGSTRGGNLDPLSVPGTGAGADEFVYAFSSVIPSTATGTWAVGIDGRRQRKYGPYDAATDAFPWPGTGETVRESPDNVVAYVNSATGSWDAAASPPSPGAVPRRTIVSEQRCFRCHGRLELHGGGRHQIEYCLVCHTPFKTDLGGRARNALGFVDLAAAADGIEERSLHLKVMVHRIHTGERKGSASLEGIAPFVMAKIYFDEVRFPNDLADCTVCHLGKSFRIEAVPADAPPTVANETATIRHAAGDATHVRGEPAVAPITAACTGCHATGATFAHVAEKTVGGVETCAQCHGRGPRDVEVAHGLAPLVGEGAKSSFSSIVSAILVPRCATTACHAAGAAPPILEAGAAYAALVGASSGQASQKLVEPGAPERSYLVAKLRGTAGDVGGIGTLMPTDGALAPADVAAIEAWIANGAPND